MNTSCFFLFQQQIMFFSDLYSIPSIFNLKARGKRKQKQQQQQKKKKKRQKILISFPSSPRTLSKSVKRLQNQCVYIIIYSLVAKKSFFFFRYLNLSFKSACEKMMEQKEKKKINFLEKQFFFFSTHNTPITFGMVLDMYIRKKIEKTIRCNDRQEEKKRPQ